MRGFEIECPSNQLRRPGRSVESDTTVFELCVIQKDGVLENVESVDRSLFESEVVIPTDAQNLVELLTAKPTVEPINVARISLEAIASVTTVDEE